MPLRDDYLAHLRESHHANKTELTKHLSIVSVAGLGYNLVRIMDDKFSNGFDFWTCLISTAFFTITIVIVLVIFYASARYAETVLFRNSRLISESRKEVILKKQRRLAGWLTLLGIGIFFSFATALSSAIMSLVAKLFF